ncbi:MAG: DUF1667 domain-containing protein [Clostridia bacterium]|nr:DUF1667 domain-containing protein [Clostridia bacterium]
MDIEAKTIVCVICPLSCQITVTIKNGEPVLLGKFCPRGERYVKSEVFNPVRVLTTTIKSRDGRRVAVRTDGAIPKELMLEVLKAVKKIPLPQTVERGQVLAENLCGLGVNLIVTGL